MSANPPLSASESHRASQLSSILRTKNNSAPTDDPNSYSESTDTVTRHSGSLSKRNYSETLQARIYNFPPFGDDIPSNPSTNQTSANFVNVEGIGGNSTQAEAPGSNASPSSAAVQDTSAVSITNSRFAPNSTITQSRMAVSGENNISAPVSITTHQYKSDSIAIPHFQTDSKTTRSLERFFPPTGRSKPFFVPNPAAHIQNAKNEFSASAGESTTVPADANNLLGTYTTSHEEEAWPQSVSFTGATALMKESDTATIAAIDILEDYTTLFDVPDMEDENIIIIDTTYLEKYGKTMSSTPDVTQKDHSIVLDARDKKNHHRTTANAQTPSISLAKNGNDFESFPVLITYNKPDTKPSMTATDTDEATSNINPINTINSLLNYRTYKESNNAISNFYDTKTILEVAKNTMQPVDSIISKTNGITSIKHYTNPNSMEPTTNTNINFKITWPLKKDTIIRGRHTVQVENITSPNNNNIAGATGSKVTDSVIKLHSNIPASVHFKTNRNNFKAVSSDEIEEVIPMVQEIVNMDQDDVVIEEVIFIHPDSSTTEIRRKVYSHNPDADYAQTSRNKITFLSDIPEMLNPLSKNKIKPFTIDSTNLITKTGNHRTTTSITANDAKVKMDIERTSVFKRANFQSNITPIIPHPGTTRPVYFSEDSVAERTSPSKLSITSSDKSTDSVDETISFSTNNNHASGGTGPNPETNFPINKGYILPSIAESPTLMPKAQNNQAQNSLLIKDDSLAGAWISDPVAKSPHLINDAIIQKWKTDKVPVNPLNFPLESTFLTASSTSPTDENSTTASAGKRTTNMTDSSELMIKKASIPEGRSTIAINSLHTKIAGFLIPKQRFRHLLDKERDNEEESIPYVEVKSSMEEDGIFQIKEDLPPSNNFKYPESENSGFERNGFVAMESTKSLSTLSSGIPTAEVTISDRDLTTPGEENVDVLYEVTKPGNGKIHFNTIATKTITNSVGESAAMKQNVEAADGTEFLPSSNSIPQSRRDHPTFSNLYYNIITDNPLHITKENPNVSQNIKKHKLSVFTMHNADLSGYRDGYQTLAAITSSNAKKLLNKGKTSGTEITNISLGSPTIVDDISKEDKNTEAVTDLASIAATSPIRKGILTMNEVNTLNNEPNKPGDDFTTSRRGPSVYRDDGTLLVASSSASMQSVGPFNHPQATNPIKKISSADTIVPKTFHNKSTPAALTIALTDSSQDVDTMLYSEQYESKDTFKEDTIVNYEAYPQKDIGILAKEEDILKEENVRDNNYVTPIAGDNVPKGNNLTSKHYSLNSDVYNSTRFKGTTKTTADQLEFENPASTYVTKVSNILLRKFTPQSQGKAITRNTNSSAEHGTFFSGDILYPMMKENVPKGLFSPERRSTFTTPEFRPPMKDNLNPALEDTVLLGKETSNKNYASYTDEQTDPGTEKDQTATGSTTNSHTSIIPVTLFIPISSEDSNVKNYYHISGTGTPLSLGYANTLRDDSFILRPETTLAKENNLDAMDLIIIEPDKSDYEYISNEHPFKLRKEENSSIKKPIPFIHRPNGFVSHTTSPEGGASKSLLYRITHPEFETEEKYQTIILKEENSDSGIVATSFKNFNTQHLKTMAPSLIDATFPSEFQERSSAEKTLSEDDTIIILPEVSDLENKKNEYFFVPYTETIVTMRERTAFGTVPIDHALITYPIKSQGHSYSNGISSKVGNTAAPELADTIKSENSNVNENKLDLAEVMPSQYHIYPLAQDIASQAKNISYVGEVTKGIIKKASIVSPNPVRDTEMSINVTTILPNAPAFDSKESNENSDSTIPEIDDVVSIKLKSLLIPNQKRPRIADALSQNDDSLPNKSVSLKPLGEHFIITDQNWEITNMQSNPQPFSMVSSVLLEDPTTFSDNPINVAMGIPITENESIYDKTGVIASVPNTVLQPVIHKKEQINESPDYAINHHINKAVINPFAKEITTSGTGANTFLRKDKAIVGDGSYISEAKIPIILKHVNSVNTNPFILKPLVASAEQKAPGTLKEMFYPASTMSTTKQTKPRARGSFSLGNDNLKRSITNSHNKSHLSVKPTLPPTDFIADFIKINNSASNPVLVKGERNIKVTDESIIARDIIVLPDKEIILSHNIISTDDIRNIINEKRHIDSTENDNVTQYEVIPFTKDFSAESDVVFLAEEKNVNNRNLKTTRLDDNTFKYILEKNTFYVGEKGESSTTKTPTSVQGFHRYGSHAVFPTAHVTESLLNENPVEPKTKQKYQILISRKGNTDSDKDDTFLKDYSAKFKSKSPRTMTPLPTDGNRKFSLKLPPDDLALEKDTLSGNDIIITLPEGKWIQHISAPDPESMETIGQSRMFTDEMTDLTISKIPVINKDQLYRRYVTFSALYYQREPAMSPKSEYNQDKNFKAESYHSQNATAPSITFNVNLDNNELPFVDENSGNKINRASISSSPVRTTHTVADTTYLSFKDSYEGGDSMQPNENNVRSREFPFLLTTESIILMPRVLTNNFVLMSDNLLPEPSQSVSVDSETGTEYLDFIHGTDISKNQDIKIQTELQSHSLDTNIPSIDSVTFTRNSTDDEADSASTMERETANISKINTDAQPLGTMMQVPLPTEISSFPSEIKKMPKLSAKEDTGAKLDLNHIINATVLIPTLETTLPPTLEPNTLSKTNNKEEKLNSYEAGNFVLGDSRILKDNPFFGKFNIPARPQAPPNLKRILSADSTMFLEKTLKPKYKNSNLPDEDAGTAGLLHNAPTGSYVPLRKSILSPDFIMSVSSELDPVVKMKSDTTTNMYNNIPFEERNTPSHKAIISPNINTSTKDMLNTVFHKRFVHRNSPRKDIITEYEIVPITENISDITSDGENIPNIEDVINTVPDNRALKYVTNEYILEPQEEKYNPIMKKTTFTYDPKIVGLHQLYSSADVSKHLFQGGPNEIKTKEMLQNLVSREKYTRSDIDAVFLKSSTDNSNSQAPKSVTHPLTHTSESTHKFLGKTTLKRDTLRGDDTITVFSEDKMMEYTLILDPEKTVIMVEGRMFPDEPTDPIVITSPLKNKNQFFRKVVSSAMYNTDAQGKAGNILSSQADNVKGKTNMAEMQYSWDNIIPLTEFNVIPKGKLSFINEDTKTLNKKASISSLSRNTVNIVDDTTTPSTESSYERGNSMPPEDNIGSRGFLALQIQEKSMFNPNASTENLEISDPVTNNSLVNSSIALSNMFKTMIEYLNSVNDGDSSTKNKTDPKPNSLTSTKLPISSTTFSYNPTKNEFDSLPSVNTETTDVSKTETDKIYSEPQRTIMNAFSPTKVSQHMVSQRRKIDIFSDQEDPATKFYLSHVANATILNSAMRKILPSVTGFNTLSMSNNNVEEEVHISKADNFFPKDASTLKDNSFTVKYDATSTKPQAHHNLKGIITVGSVLTLPEVSRSNDKSSSLEVATGERIITNTPIGTYDLPPWKSIIPSDFTTFMSSSKYSELDPVIKRKKDTTTKTNNSIPPGERNTPSDKIIISPTTILSKKDMKNTINTTTTNNNKFGDETSIGKDISTEVVLITEDISEKLHDTFLARENIPSDEDIVTIIPVDNALEYVADNYAFELVRDGNGPLTRKTTLRKDSKVFDFHSPHASAAASEHASQGSLTVIKTTKKYQGFIPKDKNLNFDNDATVLKRSSVNFNTKVPRSMIHSLTDSSWIFLPEFLGETIVENTSPIGDNTINIIPEGKRMEYLFDSDPELMIRMGGSKIFTDSTDPDVITYPIDYKNQFNRKGVSFAYYNNDVPEEAKATISAKLDANKRKPNLADILHLQNNIIPLAEFNVIPDDDLPFIGKNTEKATNRASIFSSSMNKAARTMADSIVLPTERSYGGGDSMLPGKDVKSRGFPSLLTPAILIPNSSPENPETSGLMTDKSSSESLLNRSEMLERANEYADAINGDDVSGRQVIITQADIHSYPLAWNVSPIGSTTFSDSTTDDEADSFFSLNTDTPENYIPKTDKIYFKSQRAMMKAFSLIEDSQDSVYERKKIANLFDQEDPASKLELHNFTNTTVFIPAMRKILPSGTEPNPLYKGNSNMEDSFTVKFDATSFKPQTPPNLKGIFLANPTLTLPEEPRPTSHDKVTNTGGSITNTPTGLHRLLWRSNFPPSYFTTSMRTSKYSELVPVTSMGKDRTKKIDHNIPHEKIIIPYDKGIISPIIITSEKDMANTLQGNISEHKDLLKREMAAEYEIIYFTEDISERVDNISPTYKITPAYLDHTAIMSDDSGSEYVSDMHTAELEDRADNSLIKMSTLIYAPKTHVSHAPHTTVTPPDSLSKIILPVFKARENYQAMILRQENSTDTDVIALKDSNDNVNTKAHRPTTHFLIDASVNFPSSFSDKTPVGKGTINDDDGTIIPSEGFDLEHKIIEHSLSPDIKLVADSKTFTTDTTNHAFKNSANFLRRNIAPIIYKTFTPQRGDTTTSSISDFPEDQTGIATVYDSRFSNFPSAQPSSDVISNVKENKEDAIKTALTFFYPLKKMSANMQNAPATSTKNKNNIDHYSLPSSGSVRSLKLAYMGLPEILILTSKVPTKETTSPKLIKGTNLYYPTVLISEPVSIDSP